MQTKGGTVAINDGEEGEQKVKISSYDDTDYIDVYEKDDLLVERINAEENEYIYVYEVDALSLVILDAEADA